MYVNELKMAPKPTKVYYFGNCFRYEEPQKARYRELINSDSEALKDLELLLDILDYYDVTYTLNSR